MGKNNSLQDSQIKFSFEEFKLLYESAEKVTDRRVSMNKYNYSICTAIFLAITFLWNWSLTNAEYAYGGIFVVVLLSGIATVFTFYWLAQIKDFKALNNAKFSVLNEMSKNLFFQSNDNEIKIESYEPFKKEWDKLLALSALQEKSQFKIIALKSSNMEYFIPNAFRGLYIMLFFISLITVMINLGDFSEAVKGILLIK